MQSQRWRRGDQCRDTAKLTESSVSANDAAGRGGGIYMTGTTTLTDSSVRRNEAGAEGGGIYAEAGSLTVTRSTVSDNDAVNNAGGIFFTSPETLTVTNSTLSGNESNAWGGALSTDEGTTKLINVTITRNVADADLAGCPGDGGGIDQFGPSTVNLKNTILAGNIDRSPGLELSRLELQRRRRLAGLQPDLEHGRLRGRPGNRRPDRRRPGAGVPGRQRRQDADPGAASDQPGDRRRQPGGPGLGRDRLSRHRPARRPPHAGRALRHGRLRARQLPRQAGQRVGTAGADVLVGTSAADGILGLGGDDVMRGGTGGDGLCGRRRQRPLFGEAGADFLDGGATPTPATAARKQTRPSAARRPRRFPRANAQESLMNGDEQMSDEMRWIRKCVLALGIATCLTPAAASAAINPLAVNNPAADTTARDTQSVTTVQALGNHVAVAFEDSGSCLDPCSLLSGDFTGWSSSTDSGASFADHGALVSGGEGDGGEPVLAALDGTDTVYLATRGSLHGQRHPGLEVDRRRRQLRGAGQRDAGRSVGRLLPGQGVDRRRRLPRARRGQRLCLPDESLRPRRPRDQAHPLDRRRRDLRPLGRDADLDRRPGLLRRGRARPRRLRPLFPRHRPRRRRQQALGAQVDRPRASASAPSISSPTCRRRAPTATSPSTAACARTPSPRRRSTRQTATSSPSITTTPSRAPPTTATSSTSSRPTTAPPGRRRCR